MHTNPLVSVALGTYMRYEKDLAKTRVARLYKFNYLCNMKRTIIAFGNYYNEFIKTLNEKEISKFKYILSLLETTNRMPVKFIQFIRDGLYELRMKYSGNIHRVFFIFDEKNIVVLFNGFQKKTQKTPENEIKQALKIKEAYYEYKQSHDNKHK